MKLRQYFLHEIVVGTENSTYLLSELGHEQSLVRATSAWQAFDCCIQAEHSHFKGSCSQFCSTKTYKAETPCTSDGLLREWSQFNSLASADIAMRPYNITTFPVQTTPRAKNTTYTVHVNSRPGTQNRHTHNTKHDQHNSHLTPLATHTVYYCHCVHYHATQHTTIFNILR